ncbi:hypothetical protein S-CBP1_0024 [Synechococcus phage S-CBP1]|uniref:Uncharacterized protein n=1 Tax=Synechococcus phage S-CBP1 TaxID=1273711 RepID=A0A096VKE6_9CAUD|nr:hypothetical protein S-CBP1_0024 [Synechococcus phage S-CBP1]AGK86529.1 hypothetical protein S-CBP1_0024 [Synechococcus phage S-CBP1]
MTRARIEYARGRGGGGRGGGGRGGGSRGRGGGGGGRSSGGGGGGRSSGGGGGGGRAAASSAGRSAASTGSFTSANAQALRQAGVSRSRIQNLRSQSQNINNRNSAAADARAAMDPSVAGAMEAQANRGLNIGQQFYDSPEFQQALGQSGLSPQQIAQYAMSQGYGLGNQFMDQFGTTTTNRSISGATKYRQALKIAAAQGRGTNLIGGREAKQIAKQFKNKTDLNFARSLDKINANKPNMMPIGLTGGVLNRLSRNKDGSLSRMGMMPSSDGFLKILANMNDRWTAGDARNGNPSKRIPGTGKFRRTDTIYGLMSDGSFRQTPGVGKGWADTRFGQPETTQYEPWYTPPEDQGVASVEDYGEAPLPPEEPMTTDSNQSGAGADLASFATGWKGARGARARAGRKAQGTGSMRIAPTYGAGVGSNFG